LEEAMDVLERGITTLKRASRHWKHTNMFLFKSFEWANKEPKIWNWSFDI
jgi:hypothetical protein